MTGTTEISVLGCGWLGLPLGYELAKKGYLVRGSSTRLKRLPMIEEGGIHPYHILLDPHLIHGDESFFKCDIMVLNIPPKKDKYAVDFYNKQTEVVIKLITKHNPEPVKILFISSTSVYPSQNKVMTEDDAVNPEKITGKVLLESEKLLRDSGFETTIVRFGGLIGYNRNPAKSLSGLKELKRGQAPVNLIHRDDCVNILIKIIEKSKWNFTFNACMPEHPTREEYYTHAARYLKLPLPEFSSDDNTKDKIVDSSFLIDELNYSFIYKTPLGVF